MAEDHYQTMQLSLSDKNELQDVKVGLKCDRTGKLHHSTTHFQENPTDPQMSGFDRGQKSTSRITPRNIKVTGRHAPRQSERNSENKTPFEDR